MNVAVSLGGMEMITPVTVAAIQVPAILGMDFLLRTRASLDMQGMKLTCGGRTVPLRDENSSPLVGQIHVERTAVVPAGGEIVLSGKVEGWGEKPWTEIAMVEPGRALKIHRKGIMVARAVVKMESSVPVRVWNTRDEPVSIYAGTHLAEVTSMWNSEIEKTPPIAGVTRRIATGVKPGAAEAPVPEHLQDLWQRSKLHLAESESSRVARLLVEHQDQFARDDMDLGRTNLVKHGIDTGNAVPIRQPYRRLPGWQQEEAQRQVDEMLEKKVIEPSSSPWASPIVLTKKKDGTSRFCIDYRRVNDVTLKDAYPLPRIDDTLDALAGSCWFSTLDLASGYWQVELDEEAKHKSAFAVRGGLYQWNVMPFGLCNAPSTFERLMEKVLRGMPWETLLVYLDDVIVYAKTFEEMIARLEEVLIRLGGASLKLKPKKCHLFQKKVAYLGHVVSEEGISTDPDKIKSVKEWPTPTSQTEVRSFLGLASYYRKFIQSFADIARPLHRLTEKHAEFKWTAECDDAFQELKKRLIQSPILAYPMPTGKFVLDTDASGFGIGAVLSQVQDGEERVVAYASRSLNKAERNYCVTRREMLAVVTFIRKHRQYLYGQEFEVRTDHAALRWLLNFKDPEGQLARWMEILGEYSFSISHRPGRSHGNADGLSRMPCAQCGRIGEAAPPQSGGKPRRWVRWDQQQNDHQGSVSVLHMRDESGQISLDDVKECSIFLRQLNQLCVCEDICCPGTKDANALPDHPYRSSPSKSAVQLLGVQPEWNLEKIADAQSRDMALRPIILLKKEGRAAPELKEVSSWRPHSKAYWAQWDRLVLREGVLCRKWEAADGKTERWQLLVPEEMKKTVLGVVHSSPTSGHFGVAKTLGRLQQNFYWHGHSADVRAWCRSCNVCASRKMPIKTHWAALQKYIVGGPMERIAVDMLGPLPESDSGNTVVMVVADYFTKWVEALPLPDQRASTVAQSLVENVVCRFGVPGQIHSDQGRNFESAIFTEMCELLGIEKTRTTPYNPKSDGLVERFNRTLLDAIAKLIEPGRHQRDWDEVIPYVMMAYRSSIQDSTGETPNMLMFGRENRSPIEWVIGKPDGDQPITDYVQWLQAHLRDAWERTAEKLKTSFRQQKQYYDRKVHRRALSAGELVWLYDPRVKRGFTKKLQSHWIGPYMVEDRLSEVTFRIRRGPRVKAKVVHYDRMKPYGGAVPASWERWRKQLQDRSSTDSPVADEEGDRLLEREGQADDAGLVVEAVETAGLGGPEADKEGEPLAGDSVPLENELAPDHVDTGEPEFCSGSSQPELAGSTDGKGWDPGSSKGADGRAERGRPGRSRKTPAWLKDFQF